MNFIIFEFYLINSVIPVNEMITLSKAELRQLVDDAVTESLAKSKRRREEEDDASDGDDDDEDAEFKPVPVADVISALETYRTQKNGFGMLDDFQSIGRHTQFLKTDLW